MARRSHWLMASLLVCGVAACGMATGGRALAQSGTDQGAPSRGQEMMERLRAANTTHDGRLTLEQARAANLTPIVRHFSEIDADHKGYLTIQDIRAYRQKMKGGEGGEGGEGGMGD
jgi:hypothetical protein